MAKVTRMRFRSSGGRKRMVASARSGAGYALLFDDVLTGDRPGG